MFLIQKYKKIAGFCVAVFLWTGLSACGSGGVGVEDCENDGNCNTILEVSPTSGDIPMDPEDPFWTGQGAPKTTPVELGPQLITNPQWPNPSIHGIKLSVIRNSAEIAFRLEWNDDSVNDDFDYGVEYTDQIAVMFPLDPKPEFPPIFMGDEDHVVNIWQWKAAWEKELKRSRKNSDGGTGADSQAGGSRRSSVQDLNAAGFSTLTNQDHQDALGRGLWKNKTWKVVIKRSLLNKDENDVQFKNSLPMAVAVWNGGNRETNGQKGISSWILLKFN